MTPCHYIRQGVIIQQKQLHFFNFFLKILTFPIQSRYDIKKGGFL